MPTLIFRPPRTVGVYIGTGPSDSSRQRVQSST